MSKGYILVTGGAGYIGSHTVLAFLDAGLEVVVVDNLSTGARERVPENVPFIQGNVGDTSLIRDVLNEYEVDAVVHFAGSIVVPESVVNPLKYYQNNTLVSRNLIEACVRARVDKFVFSSTAAVYGIPDRIPISESAPTVPINPYGASKLMTEQILLDTSAAHEFRFIALRYFNVAGADPSGRTGQSTPEATHLIKVACQLVTGQREYIEVYGTDYDTPDGTCIRDYIHVSDLANAHVNAYRCMEHSSENFVLNCGYGHGYSVREVMSVVADQAEKALDIRDAPRRAGDPPQLIADTTAILQHLNWRPKYDDLGFIVRTALDWEQLYQGKNT